MNKKLYWKNRQAFLLTNFVCMLALTLFLIICGNTVSSIALILILWGFILAIGMGSTYWKRKRQMQVLLTMADQLSERYLISEIMEPPERAEDQVYYRLIKMAGKSMLEQTGIVRRERIEYKEYIEQWIHEIKTPITAMKLLCENHRSEFTKEFLTELAFRPVIFPVFSKKGSQDRMGVPRKIQPASDYIFAKGFAIK